MTNHERLAANVARWIASARPLGRHLGGQYLQGRARWVADWIAQHGTPQAPAILDGLTVKDLEAARRQLLAAVRPAA